MFLSVFFFVYNSITPTFSMGAGAEGAAGACSSGPQSVHIPLSPLRLWQWDTWGAHGR